MKNKTQISIAILLSIIICLGSCQNEFREQKTVSNMDVFYALWTIIDEKYCYIEDKGIDWDGIKEEYEQKVSNIEEGDEMSLFDILSSMLGRLNDGHVNLITAFDQSSSSGWYRNYPLNFNSTLLYNYYLQSYRTAGPMDYTILKENIGYIRYSSFQSSFSQANIWYILREFENTDGLIIDLRNNTGGSIETALSLAALFFDNNTTIGYMQHKLGPAHNDFSKPEPIILEAQSMPFKWNKGAIILSNRLSYSATNLFMLAMRSTNRVQTVGGRSGGGGGIPLSYDLPNGWIDRFSSVRMTDLQGVSIEDGIEPDHRVNLVSNNKDDLIEYAIRQLKQQ